MFNLRCTKKLLDLLPKELPAPGKATNRLGDWYANIYPSDPPVLLFMSERTMLPVVIEAEPMEQIMVEFTNQLVHVLHALGVKETSIAEEIDEMIEFGIGKTASLRTTRLMADPQYHLSHGLYRKELKSLVDVSIYVGNRPWRAINWLTPLEATRKVFQQA
jgi:hypothetical protein